MKLVRAAFNTQAVRKFSSFRDIFEKPNTIPARREKFYTNEAVGADNPTYLKEASNISFGLAIAGLASGVLFILNGLKNMSYGINKK